MKNLKRNFILTIVLAFVCFIFYLFYSSNKADQIFFSKHYKGIIKEINFNEGRRGFPDIRLDSQWIYLGIEEDRIINYIKKGDSIVKNVGTKEIIIFRKDENNTWSEIKIK